MDEKGLQAVKYTATRPGKTVMTMYEITSK